MTSKTIRDMSSGARRALRAIDETASEEERQFAAKVFGRAALVAYDRIIDARDRKQHPSQPDESLNTDEAVEAEAVRLCRSKGEGND
jgi:hypothetical protein